VAVAGTAGTENIDVVVVACWELRLSCGVRTISIFRKWCVGKKSVSDDETHTYAMVTRVFNGRKTSKQN
jgi:hypothetical protein